MIVHLINMIDSAQRGTLEIQWQGWLRNSMIDWLGGQGDLANARSDSGVVDGDLSVNIGRHVLELSSKDSEDIPLLLYSYPSYTKQIVHIFFAGVSGWQLIQNYRWNRNMRLHWIGEQLPLSWPSSKTKCTAYVPEYGLMGHTIFGDGTTSNIVVLPYMPAMTSLIGLAQLRHINLLAESPTTTQEKKRKGIAVYLLGECHESSGKVLENALRDQEITELLPAIDQCLEAKNQPLNTKALSHLQLIDTKKTSSNHQSYTLSRWLHSTRVEPEGGEDKAINEEDIIATMAENSVHLTYFNPTICQDREYLLTKRSFTIYPDFYNHSLLSQENCTWQLQQFLEDKTSYLLVSSADRACVSALVSENVYQECRNRIWVVLKENERAESFSWIWHYHEQGFFHTVILDDLEPITSMISAGLDPKPINGARVCWQAWREGAQKKFEQERIGSGGFFARLTACFGNRRQQTHPEEAITYPRVN